MTTTEGAPILWNGHRGYVLGVDPLRADYVSVLLHLPARWHPASVPVASVALDLDHPHGRALALRAILQERGYREPGPAAVVFEGNDRPRWHVRVMVPMEKGVRLAACYRLAWDDACRGLGTGEEAEALRRMLAMVNR